MHTCSPGLMVMCDMATLVHSCSGMEGECGWRKDAATALASPSVGVWHCQELVATSKQRSAEVGRKGALHKQGPDGGLAWSPLEQTSAGIHCWTTCTVLRSQACAPEEQCVEEWPSLLSALQASYTVLLALVHLWLGCGGGRSHPGRCWHRPCAS